ncbi:MAG: hypothetical protein K940chlam3_00880 [Chlamydiae bacterium]|nr:hypothetical protein [Chlamydiota bacterium]
MFQFWIFIAILSCSVLSASVEESRLQITQTLEKWSKDFNSRNLQGVCKLFAPDLIASYPGTKDRNYDQMCETLSQSIHHPNKTFRYDVPTIEQMIVSDDIAIVRLIWTLTISGKNQTNPLIIREKGLDIFKKQPDGTWKIMISYAHPEK